MSSTNQLKEMKKFFVSNKLISIYDMEVHTAQELLYRVADRINELTKGLDDFEDGVAEKIQQLANEIDELLRGGRVEAEILKTLTEWRDEGVFDHLIKDSVFEDFENRLTEAKEELNEIIEDFKAYDNPQFESYPMFFKSFCGVRTSVIQDFRKVDENRWLVSQAGGNTEIADGESFTLTMCNTNGEVLSSMELINGGHGSMFNCQLQPDGSIDLYFTCDRVNNYKIIKTKYQANGKLNCSTAGFLMIPKTHPNELQLAYINFEEDKILLTTSSGDGNWYKGEVFNFLDYINGRQTTPLYTTNHLKIGNITSQGFAISGKWLFVHTGSLGADDITLRIIDLSTNTYNDYNINQLGKLSESTVTEGEGIYVDEHKNVYIGVATGEGGKTRNHNIYVYPHKTDQQHLLGKSLETAQMYKLTDANGYAMSLSPQPATIAEIVRPGWYYFTTNEMKNFSDVPEEFKVAGYWLNVYPRTKDGGIYQELIRHTSGENRWRLGRSINIVTGEAFPFRNLTRQSKVIYSGDSRALSSFQLSESIENFKEIQIRIWGAGGSYDLKTFPVSLLTKDRKFVFHHMNIGDSDSSLGLYFQEIRATIAGDYQTITYDAKIQFAWDKTNKEFTRTNDVTNIGVTEVIGIRG